MHTWYARRPQGKVPSPGCDSTFSAGLRHVRQQSDPGKCPDVRGFSTVGETEKLYWVWQRSICNRAPQHNMYIYIYIIYIYCIYIHIQSHTFLYPQTKSWFRGLALDLLFMAWGMCFAQVRIISCCNPYRKRRNKDTTGMVKKYPWGNSNLEWWMVGEW